MAKPDYSFEKRKKELEKKKKKKEKRKKTLDKKGALGVSVGEQDALT